VEATLGEPITTRDTEYGRVSVYRYLQKQYTGMVFPVPFIVVLPLYWEDGALLTVEYTPEDTVISVQMWPSTESSEEAIDLYEERAKLRQECRPPFSVASQMDKQAQLGQIGSCRRFGFATVWLWECLSAHQGDAKAQEQMTVYYRKGAGPIGQDFVQAYKWLTLAAGEDGLEGDWRVNALAVRMTPEQISEAERRASQWHPEPTECEVEFDTLENLEAPPPTWTEKWDDCHWPLAAAMHLEPEMQLQRAASCEDFGDPTVWRWTCLAAHQGDRRAQYTVGGYYRSGLAPIEMDIVEAYKWYGLSALNGSDVHGAARDFAAKKMTPSQRADAERLVADWEPNPAECEITEAGSTD